MADLISLAVALVVSLAPPLAAVPGVWNFVEAPPSFLPAERAVANWRLEAARRLDIDLPTSLTFAAGGEPRGVTRCVRLNNYWCIKGVGWTGMVAADAEGHVAFASALEGATVAALLLRRYYLDYSRRSAMAIISRWAPAQCGYVAPRVASTPLHPAGKSKTPGMTQRRSPPDPRLAGLTTRGLGSTLRARYLAARRAPFRSGRRMVRSTIRISSVPDRVPQLMRAPTIAIGLGEKPVAVPTLRLSLLLGPTANSPLPALPPLLDCSGDAERIRNYAEKAITGVTQSIDADLKLFEPDGTPLPALARVMENMSGVEIGPLKADPNLVQAGVDAATRAMRQAREGAGGPQGAAAPAEAR